MRILRNICLTALMALVVSYVYAEPLKASGLSISPGALRALSRSRSESMRQLSQPVAVAGTRGSRIEAGELYWKGGTTSAEKMIQEAELLESGDKHEEAMKVYTRIMIEGASGRALERASIGWAVCKFRMGDAPAAIRRLRDLCARSADRDIQFSASIPLALALHATGASQEAMDLLKKLVSRHPDHPLAGQAEGMILFLSGE